MPHWKKKKSQCLECLLNFFKLSKLSGTLTFLLTKFQITGPLSFSEDFSIKHFDNEGSPFTKDRLLN